MSLNCNKKEKLIKLRRSSTIAENVDGVGFLHKPQRGHQNPKQFPPNESARYRRWLMKMKNVLTPLKSAMRTKLNLEVLHNKSATISKFQRLPSNKQFCMQSQKVDRKMPRERRRNNFQKNTDKMAVMKIAQKHPKEQDEQKVTNPQQLHHPHRHMQNKQQNQHQQNQQIQQTSHLVQRSHRQLIQNAGNHQTPSANKQRDKSGSSINSRNDPDTAHCNQNQIASHETSLEFMDLQQDLESISETQRNDSNATERSENSAKPKVRRSDVKLACAVPKCKYYKKDCEEIAHDDVCEVGSECSVYGEMPIVRRFHGAYEKRMLKKQIIEMADDLCNEIKETKRTTGQRQKPQPSKKTQQRRQRRPRSVSATAVSGTPSDNVSNQRKSSKQTTTVSDHIATPPPATKKNSHYTKSYSSNVSYDQTSTTKNSKNKSTAKTATTRVVSGDSYIYPEDDNVLSATPPRPKTAKARQASKTIQRKNSANHIQPRYLYEWNGEENSMVAEGATLADHDLKQLRLTINNESETIRQISCILRQWSEAYVCFDSSCCSPSSASCCCNYGYRPSSPCCDYFDQSVCGPFNHSGNVGASSCCGNGDGCNGGDRLCSLPLCRRKYGTSPSLVCCQPSMDTYCC